MADDQEKTQQATEHRREEFRKRGDVAKSRELVSIAVLFAGFLTVTFTSGFIARIYNETQVFIFNRINFDFNKGNLSQIFEMIFVNIFKMLLPLFLVLMIVSIASNVFQTGILLTALKFDFNKINPVSKFKQIFFSKNTFIELLKAIIKVIVVGIISYVIIKNAIDLIITSNEKTLPDIMDIAGDIVYKIFLNVLLLLLFLGFADFAYQKFMMEEKMMMSFQEVKDEYKQLEGDPFIKSKRRSKQREMSMNRMMQAVPKADVVVTNPTHFAVALQYDRKKNQAPIVVAKGADLIAQKIKEIAKENKVVITENVMLARALYWNVEVGDEVPSHLFKAVAEVLAYVFKLNKEKGKKWQK